MTPTEQTKITLDNGVRVLLDRIEHVRSVSAGIYMDAGSGNERAEENGIAHFLEHALFKGTSRHSATELAYLQNRLGGQVNAYTNTESLCVHARVVDDQLPLALELLAEMVLDSQFLPEEIERERTVILDEIAMCEDDPEEAVMDLFMGTLYPDHNLGRPIIGTPATVSKFTRENLIEFMARECTADRMVISIAGSFDADVVLAQVRALFAKVPPPNLAERTDLTFAAPAFVRAHTRRPLQQTHFCFGGVAPHRTHPDRPGFALLMTALGGSTSSRIFQQVREKHGLAYNVGATAYPARNSGCYIIDGATTPKYLEKVTQLCWDEIRKLQTHPITPDELDIARRQMRASLLLGLESTNARMSRMADTEFTYSRIVPMDETLARLDAVTPDDLTRLAQIYLQDTPTTCTTIGPDKA